jgi:hypothetical protein
MPDRRIKQGYDDGALHSMNGPTITSVNGFAVLAAAQSMKCAVSLTWTRRSPPQRSLKPRCATSSRRIDFRPMLERRGKLTPVTNETLSIRTYADSHRNMMPHFCGFAHSRRE